MSTVRSVLLLGTSLALLLLSLSPGCLSTSIGRATYDGSTLLVPVTNAGGESGAALQVNVFRFQDFRQVEVSRTIVPVTLRQGTGTYPVPLQLDDGTFRLYLYVITGSDRRAGVIQDITVATHGTAPRISSR
jgi:hypothetical protein